MAAACELDQYHAQREHVARAGQRLAVNLLGRHVSQSPDGNPREVVVNPNPDRYAKVQELPGVQGSWKTARSRSNATGFTLIKSPRIRPSSLPRTSDFGRPFPGADRGPLPQLRSTSQGGCWRTQ